MTLKEALLQGQRLLEQAGVESPRLTAEVLLAFATQRDRSWLFAHANDQLIELWWIHYGRYLHQRIEGKPTQYITGTQEFYGRDFRVTPAVLIPRHETEHSIEAALEVLNGVTEVSIVDVGTGSGAIAITLVLELAAKGIAARVTATDVSPDALAIAGENARRLGAKVEFLECDLLSKIPDSSVDLVVSNPPYVALADKPTLQREVRDHEPELALFAGDDGLAVYRRLIPEAARVLKPGGFIVLEIGAEQALAVRAMLASDSERWIDVQVGKDLASLDRVLLSRKQ